MIWYNKSMMSITMLTNRCIYQEKITYMREFMCVWFAVVVVVDCFWLDRVLQMKNKFNLNQLIACTSRLFGFVRYKISHQTQFFYSFHFIFILFIQSGFSANYLFIQLTFIVKMMISMAMYGNASFVAKKT